jgi:predicted secreted protein
VSSIHQKPLLLAGGAIILLAILAGGCLNPDQYHKDTDTMSTQCSDFRGSEQGMIINETGNNAIICVNPESSLILQLNDSSRTGREWHVVASPGLQIEDKGVTLHDLPGIPPVSIIEYGIHEWNVTLKSTGIQTIKAVLQFPGRENSGTEQTFKVTIIGT